MTQVQAILDYCGKNGSITTMEAFDLGIARLASRIHEIRQMGISVEKEMVKGKNRYDEPIHYARYRIA